MQKTATDSPRRHRLTVDDYYRMGKAGILRADERVELIEGEIIDMPPPRSRHAGTVKQLAQLLQHAVGGRALVQVQDPLTLGEYSEPQPDLALLHARADFYKSRHPRAEDVLLVVEVAETSLRYDRDVKVPLYATHGVPEVWLIDIDNKLLVRYRDARAGTYARTDHADTRAPIEIEALREVRVDLSAVFAD